MMSGFHPGSLRICRVSRRLHRFLWEILPLTWASCSLETGSSKTKVQSLSQAVGPVVKHAHKVICDWVVTVSYLPGEKNKEDRWVEVQKKITPWRLGIHEQEPELQLVPQQRAARLGKLHGALLVVASLIDKPTNLGGQDQHNCSLFLV